MPLELKAHLQHSVVVIGFYQDRVSADQNYKSFLLLGARWYEIPLWDENVILLVLDRPWIDLMQISILNQAILRFRGVPFLKEVRDGYKFLSFRNHKRSKIDPCDHRSEVPSHLTASSICDRSECGQGSYQWFCRIHGTKTLDRSCVTCITPSSSNYCNSMLQRKHGRILSSKNPV